MNKLIVILGPTASGKSSMAIHLARKFSGEIISADSRQVYRSMDLGTGKISKTEQKIVPHYLLDVANPKQQFTVADFKKLGKIAVKKIEKKKKIPFVVGGTAFYIYSLIDDWNLPDVKPNQKLRNQLRKKTADQLFVMLKKLDSKRAANIDANNPVRLIRAIEIAKSLGSVPALTPHTSALTPLLIGIKKDQTVLYKLIDNRLEERLQAGMIDEVKKLRKAGLSWKRLESFGLEYRFIALYLQNKLTYNQMVEQLKSAIHKFSKRQMTWFKRDSRIKWVTTKKQAEKYIKSYLK